MEFNLEPLSPKLLASETASLFEDILNKELHLRVKATGKSMAPFLHGGEILTIRKVPGSSLHIGDLIFFKNRDGFPLLHRIVKKGLNNNLLIFQTKGDALFSIDSPVSEKEILGKVCRVEKIVSKKRTKHIDMESGFRIIINYLFAVMSLGKSKIYFFFARSGFYPSFRYIIKKVFN